MGHPVYGVGTSALVYIGDEVSDRADGVPIGKVEWITPSAVWVDQPQLCLVKRGEP